MLARSTHAWAERHVIRPPFRPTTHRARGASAARASAARKWANTHNEAWAVAASWRSGRTHTYPPLYVCIKWVMVHIRTNVCVCMCYGRVCLVTLAPRCVANYTPAAHTPQPSFHPLCTICTATTATKKQHNRKSQSDGQVFDLQVGRRTLVRVHMSLLDNLVICDFVAFKADYERWVLYCDNGRVVSLYWLQKSYFIL
jgi:hypothetical protein